MSETSMEMAATESVDNESQDTTWEDFFAEMAKEYMDEFNLSTTEDNVFNEVMARVHLKLPPVTRGLIDYYCIAEDPDDQIDGVVEVIDSLCNQLVWVRDMLETMMDGIERSSENQGQEQRAYMAFLKSRNQYSPWSVFALLASQDPEWGNRFEKFLNEGSYDADTIDGFALMRFLSQAPNDVLAYLHPQMDIIMNLHGKD